MTLNEVIDQTMDEFPEYTNQLLANKSVNYLTGQVMKLSKGTANPQLAKRLIVREIIEGELHGLSAKAK